MVSRRPIYIFQLIYLLFMQVTHAINNIYKLINVFELIFAVFMKITKQPRLPDRLIHSNFLSGMHGYELILQIRYHVIVISLLGGASGDFYDGF